MTLSLVLVWLLLGQAANASVTLTSERLLVVLDSELPRPISVNYSGVNLSPPSSSAPPSPSPPQPRWWRMVENEMLVISGNPLNQTELPKGTTNSDGANKVI